MRVLVLILTFSFFALGQGEKLTTVENVDLNKYQGKWFEIARYPNRFQKDCVSDTTANYTITKPGIVEVINECIEDDGKVKRAKGKARVVDKTSNAKLEVRFAPRWLGWLPFVWGDYWIVELENKDYSYSVVGDPKRDYLWILSRTPTLDEQTYSDILKVVEQKGFDPSKLVTTKHTGS